MKKLIMLLMLASCSPSVTETTCPDGTKCIAVNCTSGLLSHTDCLIAFGKACPEGYDITYDDHLGDYLVRCHEAKKF